MVVVPTSPLNPALVQQRGMGGYIPDPQARTDLLQSRDPADWVRVRTQPPDSWTAFSKWVSK